MTTRPVLPWLVLPAVAAAVILVSCAAAFVGLGADGMWVDELFTAYFSDPAQTDFAAVADRAAQDVNPPFYYYLVWAVARITGLEIQWAARGASAVMGCVAIAAICLAPAQAVGRPARLVAGAFAATSFIWFEMVQEARSYTLVFTLVAGMMAAGLHLLSPLQEKRIPVGPLLAMAILGFAASLTHYYAVLVAGGAFAMALTFCRSLRAALAVAGAGLALLAAIVGFLAWHVPRMVVDIQDTWFSSSLYALKFHTRVGLEHLVGTVWTVLALAVLLALLVWGGLWGGWARVWEGGLVGPVVFLGGTVTLAYLFGIGVTLGFAPMFSWRVFYVLAPVVWLGLAYLVQGALALTEGRGQALWGALAVALVAALVPVGTRGTETNTPWKRSAEAVTALPGCVSARLPVAWWEQPYDRDDDPERFYGYYMPDDPGRAWLRVPQNAVVGGLARPEVAALVAETAAGRRDCPLLFWAVHMAGAVKSEAIVAALAAHLPPGARVVVRPIRAEDSAQEARLFLLERGG